MAKIPGRLIADFLPNGEVRLVFLPSGSDKDASPVKAIDIEAAEILFMTCGLSAERAAALRAEVSRNKVAGVDLRVDEDVAARFQNKSPAK